MSVLLKINALVPDLPPGVTIVSTDWEVSTDANFSNNVYRKLGDTTDILVKNLLLDGDGPFYARSRVNLSVGSLDWSEPSVCGNAIKKPTITIEGGPLTVAPSAFIRTSDFDGPPGEVHVATDYVIYRSDNTVAWESNNNQVDLTSIRVPAGYLTPGADYLLSVRHIGTTDQSPFATYQFRVSLVSAVTPDITVEGEPAHISTGPKITTTPFSLSVGVDSHKNTEWSIHLLDSSGNATNVPVYSKTTTSSTPDANGDTLTLLNVPDGTLSPGQTYVVRVIQNGYNVSSNMREEYFTVARVIIAPPDLSVEGEPNTVPDGPELSLTPFTVLQGEDKYANTDWWIEDSVGNRPWQSIGDNVNRETIRVPPGTLTRGKDYIVYARYNGFTGLSQIVSKTVYVDYPELQTPTITVEGQASNNVPATPLITATPLQTTAASSVPVQHVSTQWTITETATGNILLSLTTSDPNQLTSLQIAESVGLVNGESYNVSVLYTTDLGNTTSANTSFTVANVAIQLPGITVSGGPSSADVVPTFTTTPFIVYPGQDIHKSTDWYVKEKTTGDLVWSSVGDTVNLTSIDATTEGQLAPNKSFSSNTEYVVTVRHNGDVASSNYSSIVYRTAAA